MRFGIIIIAALLCAGCQDPEKDAKGLRWGMDSFAACQQSMVGNRFDGRKLSPEKWRPAKSETIDNPDATSQNYVFIEDHHELRYSLPKNISEPAVCNAVVGFATSEGQARLLSALNIKLRQKPTKIENIAGGSDGLSLEGMKVTVYSWEMPKYAVELRQQSNPTSHLYVRIRGIVK
jgi:hypothetical protein